MHSSSVRWLTTSRQQHAHIFSLQRQAQRRSAASKANGALMRATPIAIWARELPPAAIAEHACADASLSHPNETCVGANACYCIAAAHLIQHPGDAEGAVAAAETWAAENAGGWTGTWVNRFAAAKA